MIVSLRRLFVLLAATTVASSLHVATSSAASISAAPTIGFAPNPAGTVLSYDQTAPGANLDVAELLTALDSGLYDEVRINAVGSAEPLTAAVSISAPIAVADLSIQSDGAITLAALDVPTAVTVTATGATTFGGIVGASVRPSALSVTGSATIAANVSTAGPQAWGGIVTVSGCVGVGCGRTVDAATAAVGFTADVLGGGLGARNLNVITSGTTTFNGSVGSFGSEVDNVTTDAGGTTVLRNLGAIVSFGDVSFADPVLLESNYDVVAVTVTFGSTLDSDATPRVLGLAVDEDIAFRGAVGATGPMGDLDTRSYDPNTVTRVAASVVANDITFGKLLLEGDAQVTGAVVDFGTVNGAYGLDVSASTSSSFTGAVGGFTPPTTLAADDAVVGSTVRTTGRQHWRGGGLQLNAGATSLTSTAGAIDVDGGLTLSGAGARTISPAIASTLGGMVTGPAGSSITKAGTGTLSLTASVAAAVGVVVDAGRLELQLGSSIIGTLAQSGGVVGGAGPAGALGFTSTGGELDAKAGDPASGDVLQFTSLGLASGTTVRTRIGTAHNLYAAGTASLAGATLAIEVAGALPAVGSQHTVLDVTGGASATGTFGGLTEGATTFAAGALWRISYVGGLDTHDVVLTRIARPTTTTLSVDTATSVAGGPVALTAVASATVGATPTGTVTFLDGTTVIGTSALTNGTATLLTSSLGVGTHSLTARFDASGDLASSTSAAAVHVVTAVPVPPTPPMTPVPPSPPVTPEPPVVQPLPVTKLYANGSCMRASRSDLRVAYTLARASKVTYTIQRRLRPSSARLTQCPTRVSIGVGIKRAAHLKLRSLVRTERAGRRTVTLKQLIGARKLAPGVHRIVIDVRDADGGKLQTVTRSFLVLAG